MKNLKDTRTKIVPSRTRGGKELPSSSALDSPSVLSKLATPTPAINSDMSQVIDDVTSAMNDAYDATTLLDKTVPLGELLDEHLARVRTIDYAEDDDISETDEIIETENFETPDKASSPRYELPIVPEGYEFSVDPELVTLVESDPFHGYESETVVAHLTKLNE